MDKSFKMFGAVCVAAVSSFLFALEIPALYSAWDADPLGWKFGEREIESSYGRSFAVLRDAQPCSKATISADIVPVSSGAEEWATIGVSLYQDKKNFWHVALVESPDKDGAKHFFELAQSYDGKWAANYESKLKVEKQFYGDEWEYSKKYNLRISMDEKGIEGEIKNEKGKTVFFKRYLFQPSNPSGEIKVVAYGAPALRITGSFKGVYSNVNASSGGRVLEKAKEPSPIPYSSKSFVPGVKREATGFFRVDKDGDGRWWAIDPLGRGIFLTGVDHVRYAGHWSRRTKRSVHHEVNKKKFPDRRDWEIDALNRLEKWGFNMLGAGCESELRRRGLVHTVFLSMGNSLCLNKHDDETWICPNESRPCTAFPNVFHPRFADYCDYFAKNHCLQHKDDPWLLGYFIHNELAWWGRGNMATGLFDEVVKKSETHTAKIALRKFLKERNVSGDVPAETKLEFLKLAAEKYFEHTTRAIRKYDPNHLVMGARFAGVWGAHDIVWEISGKYCDLVTFNLYPWADIDRNVVLLGRGGAPRRISDVLRERCEIAKKPIMITEWSFPALDSGLPCFSGAGQRFMTQGERTKATELFAKTMLSSPGILGYSYFMWVDEPEEGISDEFPEDSNYGLINLQGEAYEGLVSMFANLHRNVASLRRSPPPPEKSPVTYRNATWKGYLSTLPKPGESGVSCVRKGDSYEISNKSGLLLKGKVGGKYMFDSVSFEGEKMGTYNVMLCHVPGRKVWVEPGKVKEFSFREENGYGVARAVSEYSNGEDSFVIDHEVRIYPDSPRMVCIVNGIENTGKRALNLHSFYFRQYAKFKVSGEKVKEVPNLWRSPVKAVWMGAEGSLYWGAFSFAPDANGFTYYVNKNGGLHPDAFFKIASQDGSEDKPFVLAPGETFAVDGRFWMVSVCGRDGIKGWRKVSLSAIPEN